MVPTRTRRPAAAASHQQVAPKPALLPVLCLGPSLEPVPSPPPFPQTLLATTAFSPSAFSLSGYLALASLPQLALKSTEALSTCPGSFPVLPPPPPPHHWRGWLGWVYILLCRGAPRVQMTTPCCTQLGLPRSLWTLQPGRSTRLTGVHSVAQLVFPGPFPAGPETSSFLASVLRLLQYMCFYGLESARPNMVWSAPNLISSPFFSHQPH